MALLLAKMLLKGKRRLLLALMAAAVFRQTEASTADGNRFTYLDESDPFYPSLHFPKLTTPQWVGEEGVEAVVILAVDDMAETSRYEQFLRPILERLKQIDGRAPVSIMTETASASDLRVQKWLKEGLTLEVHTVKHPCPLLAGGNLEAGAATYNECVDILSAIPGNKPVAFRMPCCDSMNSPSPRFYAEIFNRRTRAGNFLTMDSSVMNRITTNDASLSAALTYDSNGHERSAKYFPAKTNATTRVGLRSFATTIEDYPYPYVIGKLCWEFPCAVPSDWEAHNAQGSTNEVTVSDWKAVLDATILKKGVMTMVFHPHGWIRSDQMLNLIDYAVGKYGKKVKFLNFKEAQERLNRNLLMGQALRGPEGEDNGVRLLDLNGDGFMDVMIGDGRTRLWNSKEAKWIESSNLQHLILKDARFGVMQKEPVIFFKSEQSEGAWRFSNGEWREAANFFSGLNVGGQPVLTSRQGRDAGVRLRDLDNDGECELLVGNAQQNAIFGWANEEHAWKLDYQLPKGAAIVNAKGEDNGVRFVDLNGDGYDDLLLSNEKEYGVYIYIANKDTRLGWEKGWSYAARAGKRGQGREIPMMVRGGEHPNNGAWFHGQKLFVQNEDTATLPDRVMQLSFQELLGGGEPQPKTPEQGLVAFKIQGATPKLATRPEGTTPNAVANGWRIELVASEPAITDPVAFDWGADGKLWVVEMRDYPLGMDGKGKAGGAIRVLEDRKKAGRYDKGTTFIQGLNFPNGIMPWRKGVLISAAPDIIYAEDTDGDGVADVKKILYTGFGQGNQQHRINGFEYGLDNWIYLANGGSDGQIKSIATGETLELRGHDLRIRPDDGSMELQPGPTQFGRHRDDWGNWFGNDNGRWGWHFYLPERYLGRNPNLAIGSMVRQMARYAGGNRVFAVSQAQQRFNWPSAVLEVTSACSATPYRDDIFGPEFSDSIFMCEPANNVVHREMLAQDDVTFTSHRPAEEKDKEFLASTDNWCRPVMVKTGPDGALYIADMYRLIIEHPEYFPEELKHRPDLRAGEDKGRIYRVYPEGARLRKPPRLDQLDGAQLAAAMESPNGWQRDTIQRLLVEKQDQAAIEPLRNLVARGKTPKTRLQALSTLDGLHAISPELLSGGFRDEHWAVRRHAVELAEPWLGKAAAMGQKLAAMVNDPDIRVRYQVAFSLGEWHDPQMGTALAALALSDWDNESMRTAILSSASECFPAVLGRVLEEKQKEIRPGLVESLVNLAAATQNHEALATALQTITDQQRQPQAWQLAGLAGLLDALSQKNVSLEGFSQTTGDAKDSLNKLQPIFARARELASKEDAPEPERLLAIRLLGRSAVEGDEDPDRLGKLLGPQNTSSIQKAALARLGRMSGVRVAGILIAAWRNAGLTQRQEIQNFLFSRQQWIEAVLTALEQQQVMPAELGTVQRQKLLGHSSVAIRERAAKIFAASNADRQKVVEAYKAAATLKGDSSRGHKFFTQACAICHRLNGEGQNVGPDLGTMANKPVEELLVAILDPNQAVDPSFTSYHLVTKDDRDLTGILVAETPNSITLRMAGGAQEVVLRNNVQSFRSQGKSLMPEGLESALKPQDMADLIAYVLNPK